MFKAKRNRSIVFIAAVVVSLMVLLDGCQVGPKYQPPTPTAVDGAELQGVDGQLPGSGRLESGQPPGCDDPRQVVGGVQRAGIECSRRAAQSSTTKTSRYRSTISWQARAIIAEARSQYWPTITAGASWNRSRSSSNLRNSSQANTGTTSTLWSLPLNVSWTPDLWGKIRNEVHSAEYATQVSAADLELEKLTEQASLAQFFFEIRGQDMLQQILNQTVEVDQKALDATQGAYDCGSGRLHLRCRSADNPQGCAVVCHQRWAVARAV